MILIKWSKRRRVREIKRQDRDGHRIVENHKMLQQKTMIEMIIMSRWIPFLTSY